MSRRVKRLLTLAIGLSLATGIVIALFEGRGFSTREEPHTIEVLAARAARYLAIPDDAYEAANPIAPTPGVLDDARVHFADHCAVCHANDGSGDTPIGRNLYPKAPDMREPPTQLLTDGELFYIITNGIRLSGMPAWGSGDAEDDHGSWGLVHFIRHLPIITNEEVEEMRELNPVSRSQLATEELERRFLEGDPPARNGHGGHH